MQESRPKIWKSLGIDKEDCERRRGWAFDFGDEFQVFPIVVEDLEYPGQMLIEVSFPMYLNIPPEPKTYIGHCFQLPE